MTTVVLVRHGEAQSLLDGIVGGDKGCSGLSDHGRDQVEALGARLTRTGQLGEVDAVYASSLPRATETGEILARHLGVDEIRIEPDVREWDPGPEMDGRPWEEIEAAFPRPDPWTPHDSRFPGSETWAEFSLRVGRGLHRIARDHEGGTIVVACHGGVVEQSVIAFGGLSHHGEHVSFHIANSSLTEWFRPDPDQEWWRPVGRWRLIRLNDAAHLEHLE